MRPYTKYLLNHPVEGRKRSDAFKGMLFVLAIATALFTLWYATPSAEITYSHHYYAQQAAMR